MNLSRIPFALALGATLLLPAAGFAVPPVFRAVPSTYYGYEMSQIQQAYFQYYEQQNSVPHPAPPPGTTTVITSSRYVTVLGPDNNPRTFRIDRITQVPPPHTAARVPRFGSNR